jgi:hypothetical protein
LFSTRSASRLRFVRYCNRTRGNARAFHPKSDDGTWPFLPIGARKHRAGFASRRRSGVGRGGVGRYGDADGGGAQDALRVEHGTLPLGMWSYGTKAMVLRRSAFSMLTPRRGLRSTRPQRHGCHQTVMEMFITCEPIKWCKRILLSNSLV